MALLNNKFDILRGWPSSGAFDVTFPAHVTSGVADTLPPGSVVSVQSDGSVALASTPDLTAADALPVWVVIEGNTDFSGTFLGKVVCLRGNAVFRLDASNFAAGVYAVGTLLSFDSGQFKVAATKEQVIGEVLKNDISVDGTLQVFFSGGMTKKI
jgi:hypothetical protein